MEFHETTFIFKHLINTFQCTNTTNSMSQENRALVQKKLTKFVSTSERWYCMWLYAIQACHCQIQTNLTIKLLLKNNDVENPTLPTIYELAKHIMST